MPRIPSTIGDVLMLRTTQTFTIFAVGLIAKDGQQDFAGGRSGVAHTTDMEGAVAVARSLRRPGQRIFLLDIDDGEWSEISPDGRQPHVVSPRRDGSATEAARCAQDDQ
jgi:hypothetical protein